MPLKASDQLKATQMMKTARTGVGPAIKISRNTALCLTQKVHVSINFRITTINGISIKMSFYVFNNFVMKL